MALPVPLNKLAVNLCPVTAFAISVTAISSLVRVTSVIVCNVCLEPFIPSLRRFTTSASSIGSSNNSSKDSLPYSLTANSFKPRRSTFAANWEIGLYGVSIGIPLIPVACVSSIKLITS